MLELFGATENLLVIMNLRPPNTIAILVGTPKGIRYFGKPPDFQNIDLEIALDVAHPRTCEPSPQPRRPGRVQGLGIYPPGPPYGSMQE